MPSVMRFSAGDPTRLTVVFSHTHFKNDETVRLDMDAGRFLDESTFG